MSTYWDTTCEVQEVELDPVRVFYESSPPEPDVNWGGDLEITGVEYQGREVGILMSVAEQRALLDSLNDYLNGLGEDDGYGDYLYDQMKDAKAEERSK